MLYFYEFSIVLGMLMKICCSFDLSIKKVQIQNWLTETCLFLQMSGIHKEKHSLILMLIPECLACQLFSCYCEVNTSTVSIWKNLAEECSRNTRQDRYHNIDESHITPARSLTLICHFLNQLHIEKNVKLII